MPPLTEITLLGALLVTILGALIGSFSNVVIFRLPRGESIAFPGSHCPTCNRSLGPLELVPVLSWVLQKGRCRGCNTPISARYPLVELVVAVGYLLIWLRWPFPTAGWAFLPLAVLFTVLVILAFIDLDTYTLPDVLTLPALPLALAATLLYPQASSLPGFESALGGALLGAGILALVNRVGALVLRRMKDTSERLWPVGFDQVNVAALAGAVGGLLPGVAVALLSLIANLVTRRILRLPEGVLYLLLPLALLLSVTGITADPLTALSGSVGAAGAAALLGAIYWWIHDLVRPPQEDAPQQAAAASQQGTAAATAITEDDQGEPIAMGFGDVKLAAVLGALLGPGKLLLMLFLSFLIGAVGGLLGRALGGERAVPFGPYLVLATLITLFVGDAILNWYLGMLGV